LKKGECGRYEQCDQRLISKLPTSHLCLSHPSNPKPPTPRPAFAASHQRSRQEDPRPPFSQRPSQTFPKPAGTTDEPANHSPPLFGWVIGKPPFTLTSFAVRIDPLPRTKEIMAASYRSSVLGTASRREETPSNMLHEMYLIDDIKTSMTRFSSSSSSRVGNSCAALLRYPKEAPSKTTGYSPTVAHISTCAVLQPRRVRKKPLPRLTKASNHHISRAVGPEKTFCPISSLI
jgi:hypothetical protein